MEERDFLLAKQAAGADYSRTTTISAVRWKRKEREMLPQSLRRLCLGLSLLAIGGAAAPPAGAQTYPSGMIRVIVPSPAGTPPDIMGRIVANELSESEGWRVVVENKPGAIMTIGLAEVLRQPADGHTLASIALPASAAPALLPNLNFRLEADFIPVIKLASAYHILVVTPSVPAKSLPEFVALLKNQPNRMTFSSGGFGTPAHLAGEMFKLQTGVQATHVPYQGLAKAIPDLMNGTNQFQFITPLPVLQLIAEGKLRALAVTGPARLPALKDVPTVGEAGFLDLIIQDWFGLLLKIGTSNDIVTRLNAALNRLLTNPRVRKAIEEMAAEPAGGTPAEFGQFLGSQVAHWNNVVKESGIKMHQ